MVQSQSRSLPQLLTPARARPAPSPTCDSSSAADIRAQRTLVTIAAAASGLGDRDGRSRRQGIEALGDYEYPFKLFYSGLQARGRDVAPPCRAADRSRGLRVRPRLEPGNRRPDRSRGPRPRPRTATGRTARGRYVRALTGRENGPVSHRMMIGGT